MSMSDMTILSSVLDVVELFCDTPDEFIRDRPLLVVTERIHSLLPKTQSPTPDPFLESRSTAQICTSRNEKRPSESALGTIS